MRKWGLRARGSGIAPSKGWWLTVCAAAGALGLSIVTSAVAESRAPAGGERPGHARITVRVFCYVPLGRKEYENSKFVAAVILKRAGVEIAWLDCRLEGSDQPKPARCGTRFRPDEIGLRILSIPRNAPRGMRHTMGVSELEEEGGRGSLSSVYYDRVAKLAHSGSAPRSVVLGHAMAHELGHLLLRTGVHTATGIMRAVWQPQEVREAARSSLNFSGHQAKQMRAEALARTEDAKTVLAASEPAPAEVRPD